jgi:hypothetical protein
MGRTANDHSKIERRTERDTSEIGENHADA